MMVTTDRVNMESLVRTELPPLPRAALRVAELTKDLTVSTRVIAETIGADPVLTANIIRAANSPLYARERPITTIPAAVTALGNHAIHMLVVVLIAFDFFHRKTTQTSLRRSLWEHAITTAFSAREICTALGLRLSEQAFLCGLLHDIGRLLLLCHDSERYAQLSQNACERTLLERERETYGYTHAEIGEHVAQHWKLPIEIGRVIQAHHQPEEASEYALITYVIDAADALSNASSDAQLPHDHDDETRCCGLSSVKLIVELGITDEQLQDIWTKATMNVKELEKFFS